MIYENINNVLHAMNHHKASLINRRDYLLDEYLDTHAKLEKWMKNSDNMIVCKGKAHKSGETMIKILKDHLRDTSRKLRIIDAELTGIKKIKKDLYTSILEIY